MYYIKYNEIDLTDMVKVRSVEIPSLPAIEHSSITMFERDGNIYNGLSYNNREINLVLLIQPEKQMVRTDPEDPESPLVYSEYKTIELYEQYIRDIKRTFYTKEEARLFCGDEHYYMWCVPTGDVVINELGIYCAEMEISLIAYDPYWYSKETYIENNYPKEIDNTTTINEYDPRYNLKKFTVSYKGDVPVYPTLSIGFNKNTTFCQIENQETGEKILIGGVPQKEGTIIQRNAKVLDDNMQSTSGWTKHTSPLDSGRGTSGGIGVTKDGCGIMASNFGSSGDDYIWYGACARKSLSTPVKDFKVRVRMNHNSTGSNGDPTHPFENDYKDSTSSTSTETIYYYEVTPSVGLRLRKGPSTNTAKICTMPKGTKLYPTSINNGWAYVTYNGKSGYCYTQYLAKKSSTTQKTTGSDGQCNYVAIKPAAIRASASKTANIKKTISSGKCVRVYTTKYPVPPAKEEDRKGEYETHYKLAKAYEGVTGYVSIDDLVEASNYSVEYDYELDLAEHKTGTCEIYGYSNNGEQLFRMGMHDDNEYYEFTYPVIRKNGADFLVDKTTAPSPKIREEYNSSGKKVSKVASGRYGDWNEFYGELYIERVNNIWYAYVQKLENGQVVKEIKSHAVTDTNRGEEKLGYLVIYFGTSNSNAKDASCMSITHVEVKTASEIDNTITYNFQEFEAGDILQIDNSIPEVRLNNKECSELVDVGSNFFALIPGDNNIKISSDDSPNVDVIWNNKNL